MFKSRYEPGSAKGVLTLDMLKRAADQFKIKK